jgi:hypothetical protein
MIPAQTTLVPAREGRAGPALDGLTLAEARERAAAGQVNAVPAGPGRSLGQILRANPCTRFNAILGTLFGVVLVVGPPQDALFGLVLAANTAIGVAAAVLFPPAGDRRPGPAGTGLAWLWQRARTGGRVTTGTFAPNRRDGPRLALIPVVMCLRIAVLARKGRDERRNNGSSPDQGLPAGRP